MTSSSSDDEYKPGAVRQEKHDTPPAHYEDTDVDGIEEKKLIRKIDWRLLPILGALYSISLASQPTHVQECLLIRADRPYQHRQCASRRYGCRPRTECWRQIHHRSRYVFPDLLSV